MRHASSRKIFEYWDRLRKGQSAPNRCDIEPSDIRDVLGDTFILEINPTYRTVAFRLAGTRLCHAHGRELKGVGFLGLWDEADNMKVLESVRKVYQEHQICTMSSVAQSEGQRFMEYETILLPLTGEHADDIRILGVTTPKTEPYWLGADPIVNSRLNAVRFRTEPVGEIKSPSSVTPFAQTGSKASAATNSLGQRKVKHLLVFEGGRQD